MARIPLYERAPQINTGTQALVPMEIKPVESGLSKGLLIAGENLKAISTRIQQTKEANELSGLSMELRNKSLEFSQAIQGDYFDRPDEWESLANEKINSIYEVYNTKKLSPENRLRVNEELNRWSTNLVIDAKSAQLRRNADSYRTNLNSALSIGESERNYSLAREQLEIGRANKVITEEEYNAGLTDISLREQDATAKDFEDLFKTTLEMGNYDGAKSLLDSAFNSGVVKSARKKSLETTIEYKFQYDQRLENAQLEAMQKPVDFLRRDLDKPENVSVVESGKPSKAAVEFIKSTEGFFKSAYKDGAQYSIGWGTKARFPGEVISEEEAEARLSSELEEAAKAVDSYNLPVNENQRAALISYAYNTGPGSTKDGTGLARLIERLNKDFNGDLSKLPDVLRTGVKTSEGKFVQGLENRRNKEAILAATPPVGSATFKPMDAFRLRSIAEKEIVERGGATFENLKAQIELGQYSTPEEEKEFNSSVDSDPYMTDLMKQSIKNYRLATLDKRAMNSRPVIESIHSQIEAYSEAINEAERRGAAYDPNGFEFMQLGNLIDSSTSEFVQTELRNKLRNIRDNREARSVYGKMKNVNSLLRSNILDVKPTTQKTGERQVGGLFGFGTKTETFKAFKEEKFIDEEGNEITRKVPVYDEMSVEEKNKRLQDYDSIQKELETWVKSNPNATSTQIFAKGQDIAKSYRYNIRITGRAPTAANAETTTIDFEKEVDTAINSNNRTRLVQIKRGLDLSKPSDKALYDKIDSFLQK